jgi:A/G-specific adenine glycosylase
MQSLFISALIQVQPGANRFDQLEPAPRTAEVQTMAKRRVSSDDFSSDEDYASSGAAPPPQKPRKATKTTRQPVKKKHKTGSVNQNRNSDEVAEEAVSQSWVHASSIHTISAPKALRVALLEWYAGVHETRGMPWRKPYDSSLGLDARAQRAYEVSFKLAIISFG